MVRINKLILVTAKHMPQHKYFVDIAKEFASRLGVELEVREEDYVFLNEHGEKDEFGMAWLPQLFIDVEGQIRPILTKLPINERTLTIDIEKAKNQIIEILKSLGINIES